MKLISNLAIPLAIGLTAITLCGGELNLSSFDKHEPKLEFINSRFVELGIVNQGDTAEAKINYRNLGDSDLFIYNVSKTCNCTEVILQDKKLSPKAISSALIKISTSGKLGPQTVVVRLMTNGEQEYYIIRVNLTVKNDEESF